MKSLFASQAPPETLPRAENPKEALSPLPESA